MTERKIPASAAPLAPPGGSDDVAPFNEVLGSVLATQSGPSSVAIDPDSSVTGSSHPARMARQKTGQQALAQAMPENPLKAGEYDPQAAGRPLAGVPNEPLDDGDTASTVTEDSESTKVGDGSPSLGYNPGNESLDRVRVDSGGQRLTTNQGVAVSDNQNSLKAGLRGPALLEDFILREKITHFDHERIPERVVHARGSGAHGYFESYEDLSDLTIAAPFAEAGKRTPTFVRFSTVAGERGSADTVRDVRGFAVKFYTDQGNWDLVGNNIPVFFIQDAMKFPDLVHALKPEPHFAMPQASSAHDTFWDFVSLMPESTHMLLWVMSDRAIPRSYRTMQGFGVHTFRLVNALGESVFCKFHWSPLAGTHSLIWDEAVKIAGADPDYHRRDLWEAIEAGNFPEYELAVQTFSEAQAEDWSFDVLDATKIVPEELVPLRPVGRLVLNRNPDNFFAETEQVAFCTAHIVPGIDFSNDPLLQGRIHSYVDTQLTRLGGPNFHEIPINGAVAQVHNNQRDGLHRQAIARGRVAYEPNSLAGGCPFQAGTRGFVSFPEPVEDDKVRGKPERFAEHYAQARLFWNSQSPVEKKHIVGAFRFELTRVQTQAVRERVISLLANVDDGLARAVAAELGFTPPVAQPPVGLPVGDPEVEKSAALSLFARPGDGNVRGLRIALVVADGVAGESLGQAYTALAGAGAAPRFVGARLGAVRTQAGPPLHAEITLEAAPSALWDGVILPDGEDATGKLAGMGQLLEFIKDQYRHCKPILALGSARALLEAAAVPLHAPGGLADAGLIFSGPAVGAARGDESQAEVQTKSPTAGAGAGAAIVSFMAALAKRRNYERESDPPKV